MKATKKPVTIECFKYDGDLKNSNGEYYVPEWAVEAEKNGTIFFKDHGEMYIKTLEGDHHASVGDYIIRGVNGELYPCKPDIFEKTYDVVDDDSSVCEFVETYHDLLTTKYTKVFEEADYKYNTPCRFNVVRAEDGKVLEKIHFQEGSIKECGKRLHAGRRCRRLRVRLPPATYIKTKENTMAIELHHLNTHGMMEQAGNVLDGVVRLKARIAELEEERRWRKFSEEKPKEKQWILVHYPKHSNFTTGVEVRRWDEGFKYDVEVQEIYDKWMPLPSAPKEEK